MTWPSVAGPLIRVTDLGDARTVVDFMLRPGVEARLKVAPTALADGYMYEVVLRRFVTGAEIREASERDEPHIVRSVN